MSARTVASRQLEISVFLQSWGPLRNKLQELLEAEQSAIDEITSGFVKPESINDLNTHILQKKAIKMVFNLVEELREDLHPNEVSKDSGSEE